MACIGCGGSQGRAHGQHKHSRANMPQSALIFSTGPDGSPLLTLANGIQLTPGRERSNSYLHNREWQVVRIDRIEPSSWVANCESIPTVYVSPITMRPRR